MKYVDMTSEKPTRLGKVPFSEEQSAHSAQVRLMALGAVMAMALLSGCVSQQLQGDPDQSKYNPETGYPAVGSSHWVSL